MPINVKDLRHWIFLPFNVQQRTLTMYDSMSGKKHEKYILHDIEAFAVLIPLLLEMIDFYFHKLIFILARMMCQRMSL